MLLVVVLAWPMVSSRARVALVVLAALVTAFGGGLRIAMGRHFLSDVVISVLISALVVASLWRVFDMRRLRRARPADLRADLVEILGPPARRDDRPARR